MTDIDGFDREDALGIAVRRDGDTLVLALSGELDLASSGLLGDALACLLETDHSLVVDLDDVTFADTAGLSPIVEAAVGAQRRGGGVLVTKPPPAVRAICAALPHVGEPLGIPRQFVSLSN